MVGINNLYLPLRPLLFVSDIIIEFIHTRLLEGIQRGQTLGGGAPFGVITNTGRTFGPHAHIQFRFRDILMDPNLIFK
jgi:hypothetical protein